MRLDDADLDQWRADVLGEYIGYLPQDVSLLDGSIAENISNSKPSPMPARSSPLRRLLASTR